MTTHVTLEAVAENLRLFRESFEKRTDREDEDRKLLYTTLQAHHDALTRVDSAILAHGKRLDEIAPDIATVRSARHTVKIASWAGGIVGSTVVIGLEIVDKAYGKIASVLHMLPR